MLDIGTNFISDKCRTILRQLNIEEAINSSYHQSSGHVGACIKDMKHTIRKCLDNDDVIQVLLQMRSTPIGAGLPSPATLLF